MYNIKSLLWKVFKDSNSRKYGRHLYEISNMGRIRKDGEIIEPSMHNRGYACGCGSMLHRVAAELFIPNPENKPEVNHINGDKMDFSVDNLEWVTHKENIQHAVRTGLFQPGMTNKRSGHMSTLGKKYNKKATEASLVQVACPYCNKSGAKSGMKRWHFENCKYKNEI